LIAQTVNNEVVFDKYLFTIQVVGDAKYVYIPDGKDYDIKITAFDEGVMQYSVISYSSDSIQTLKDYRDVSLEIGKTFSSFIKSDSDKVDLLVLEEDEWVALIESLSWDVYPDNRFDVIDLLAILRKLAEFEDEGLDWSAVPSEHLENGEVTVATLVVAAKALKEIGRERQANRPTPQETVVKTPLVKITGIEINSLPTKIEYVVGEKFNASGLALNVNYSDGTTEIATEDFITTITGGTVLNTVGEQTVVVIYDGKIMNFQITVTDAVNTVTLTFNKNDGSGDYVTFDSSRGINIPTFTRNDYTFLGWSKDKNATVADIALSFSNVEMSTTFYAVWEQNIQLNYEPERIVDFPLGIYTFSSSLGNFGSCISLVDT
jgi:uncharacterized repeat protein (TIGR02543 family)